MFAILGFFGVMMAGLVADALMSGHDDQADAPEDDPPEEEGPLADGNLVDDLSGDPTIPTSDDIDDPADQDVEVVGTEDADILDGHGGNDVIGGGEGADLINGRDGDDSIKAGAGNDAVWAGAGDDTVLVIATDNEAANRTVGCISEMTKTGRPAVREDS